jgi:MYXO-CTERM domain-containing protein
MRTLHALAATSLLVLGVSAVSHAQQTDTDTQRMATDDHDTDMGWLGLLGLAGLLGLKRKDRDATIVRRDNTGTASRP